MASMANELNVDLGNDKTISLTLNLEISIQSNKGGEPAETEILPESIESAAEESEPTSPVQNEIQTLSDVEDEDEDKADDGSDDENDMYSGGYNRPNVGPSIIS